MRQCFWVMDLFCILTVVVVVGSIATSAEIHGPVYPHVPKSHLYCVIKKHNVGSKSLKSSPTPFSLGVPRPPCPLLAPLFPVSWCCSVPSKSWPSPGCGPSPIPIPDESHGFAVHSSWSGATISIPWVLIQFSQQTTVKTEAILDFSLFFSPPL